MLETKKNKGMHEVGRVDELLGDNERLHSALADAVQMIRDEVIDIL